MSRRIKGRRNATKICEVYVKREISQFVENVIFMQRRKLWGCGVHIVKSLELGFKEFYLLFCKTQRQIQEQTRVFNMHLQRIQVSMKLAHLIKKMRSICRKSQGQEITDCYTVVDSSDWITFGCVSIKRKTRYFCLLEKKNFMSYLVIQGFQNIPIF